jgi:hypothetical protein
MNEDRPRKVSNEGIHQGSSRIVKRRTFCGRVAADGTIASMSPEVFVEVSSTNLTAG